MGELWKSWAGRTVNGRFALQAYLGGSDHSAVFLTLAPNGGGSEKAAIKLIPADAALAEKQLLRWEGASELTHPNLVRMFEAGHSELDGTALLYMVEEYAEENLSQVLPERGLTAEEARGMLPPVLRALQFLHDQGFVHARIQPSNVLAIDDQVKLSCDSLTVPGEGMSGPATTAYDPPEAATGTISAASDVWQLGMMLNEVLTRRLPDWDVQQNEQPRARDGISQPFAKIIENCLRLDPAKRWTVAQIAACLEERQPEAPSAIPAAAPIATPVTMSASSPSVERGTRSVKWPYAIALIVGIAIAIVIFLAVRPRPASPTPETQSKQAEQGTAADRSQPAQSSPQPQSSPGAAVGKKVEGVVPVTGDESASRAAGENGVLHRVIPQVLPHARKTIQGKIKVRVKDEVDATGNVAKAKLESAGPSKYFSRIAMEAAREWKFTPAQAGEQGAAREWNLQFSFSRTKTDVSAARARR
jgi:TonB family protein